MKQQTSYIFFSSHNYSLGLHHVLTDNSQILTRLLKELRLYTYPNRLVLL